MSNNKKIFVGYIIIWGSLYLFSGLLFSGWHMMEDHEFLSLYRQYNNSNILSHFCNMLKMGEHRISPMLDYLIYIGANLWYSNFWIWHLIKLLIIILTSYILYKICYKFSKNILLSFILPFSIYLGTSTEIITRIATIEVFSILLYSGVIYLIIKDKYKFLLPLLMILMCFSKENMILTLPSLLIFSYFLNLNKSKTNKNLIKISIFISVCVALVLLRKLIVGESLNESSYVIPYHSFREFIETIKMFFFNSNNNVYYFVEIALLLILMLFTLFASKLSTKKKIILGLYFLSISIPQFFLYVNVGFSGRYFTPTNIAFLIVTVIALSKIENTITQKIFYLIVFSLMSVQLLVAFLTIKEYIIEGKSIERYVEVLSINCKDKPCNILLVGDKLINIEMFQANIEYGNYINPQNSFKIFPLPTNKDKFLKLSNLLDTNSISMFEKSFEMHYEKRLTKEIGCEDYNFIVFLGEVEDTITNKCYGAAYSAWGENWYSYKIISTDK